MKSPYQIAKELKVSPQAVYKRMTDEFNNQYEDHIERAQSGKYKLDAVAEEALKELFNQVKQPLQQHDMQPIEQPTQSLVNQLNTENEFLRVRVEELEAELKVERAHSRGQFDKITELAENLAKLANNAQQLHGADIIPRLSDGGAADAEATNKPSFFARLFGK